jgi:hypothetical protein
MEEEFIRSADGSETVTVDQEAVIMNLIRENNRCEAEIERLRAEIKDVKSWSVQEAEIEQLRAALKDARIFIAGMVLEIKPAVPGVFSIPASYYPCYALLETIDKALGHD